MENLKGFIINVNELVNRDPFFCAVIIFIIISIIRIFYLMKHNRKRDIFYYLFVIVIPLLGLWGLIKYSNRIGPLIFLFGIIVLYTYRFILRNIVFKSKQKS